MDKVVLGSGGSLLEFLVRGLVRGSVLPIPLIHTRSPLSPVSPDSGFSTRAWLHESGSSWRPDMVSRDVDGLGRQSLIKRLHGHSPATAHTVI
jgi:hypothetical protein